MKEGPLSHNVTASSNTNLALLPLPQLKQILINVKWEENGTSSIKKPQQGMRCSLAVILPTASYKTVWWCALWDLNSKYFAFLFWSIKDRIVHKTLILCACREFPNNYGCLQSYLSGARASVQKCVSISLMPVVAQTKNPPKAFQETYNGCGTPL